MISTHGSNDVRTRRGVRAGKSCGRRARRQNCAYPSFAFVPESEVSITEPEPPQEHLPQMLGQSEGRAAPSIRSFAWRCRAAPTAAVPMLRDRQEGRVFVRGRFERLAGDLLVQRFFRSIESSQRKSSISRRGRASRNPFPESGIHDNARSAARCGRCSGPGTTRQSSPSKASRTRFAMKCGRSEFRWWSSSPAARRPSGAASR